MYHANLFPLIRHEPLPVYRYRPTVDPQPTNKPQLYQVLGALAKQIVYAENKPVVSTQGSLESLGSRIANLEKYRIEIPEVEVFTVHLEEVGGSSIGIDHFDNYRLLINRLADMALTIFSSEYYKFHPDAPYILRDEPYFDKGLIEATGIIDSKKYYRGLHQFSDKLVFILNRETQLRSYENLLTEMQSLKKRFETVSKSRTSIDFYDPPEGFTHYINSLLVGKAADVLPVYPGPRVPRIKEVTWKYRGKDVTPGMSRSHIDYFHDVYGLRSLDPLQPLIVYELPTTGRTQFHLPQILSVGHDFRDLERRIPSWQRTQVWGTIHPDCKNQLQKIYGVLLEIDENLRRHLPEIYPRLVEISTKALDVTSLVSQPAEINLQFGNKDISIKSPYDVKFYSHYSGKKVTFARPVGDVKALVCVQARSKKVNDFLDLLSNEYSLRNNARLSFDFDKLDLKRTDYSGYQLVLVIERATDDETYGECKRVIQNEHGIVHQHITEEHADEDSVMALVMQLSLKLGGDPWLLPEREGSPTVIGIHSYRHPNSGEERIFVIVLDGRGALLKQFEPVEPAKFEDVARALAQINKERRRALYLFSFDRFEILQKLKDALAQIDDKPEYCIIEVKDQDYLRFFETWTPKRAPRFGKAAAEIVKSPIEAEEKAPAGIGLKFNEDTFFLLTGRTIEKGDLKRGCPTPIRVSVRLRKGDGWKVSEIADYVFKLCMMGRSSGNMTSFPSPIYYLKLYGHYFHDFGMPGNERIRDRIFYV